MLALRKKILKAIAKIIPGNAIRIHFLRQCCYKIGKDVYIGEDIIIIDDLEKTEMDLVIEDRVAISPRVTFVMHSAPNWSKIRPYHEKRGGIVVKKDAWIGTGAVILPNIEIGEGAIVGANSVVTENVQDYTVVGGIPAVKIKTLNVRWRKGNSE